MSFPVIVAVADASPDQQPENTPQEERKADTAAVPRTGATCQACDGTGFWRGIDGFTFRCTECTFEMT